VLGVFGGGVLIAVCKDIVSFLLNIPNNSVQQLFVHFSYNSLNIIISSVYIPPSSFINYYAAHIDTIDFIIRKYLSHIFLLVGNYNLPFISWSNNTHGLLFHSKIIFDYTSIPEQLASAGFSNITKYLTLTTLFLISFSQILAQ
jgi:hypothetical protein